MKRTHLSTGLYPRLYLRALGRVQREKHITACGSVCDFVKATTVPARVTCRACLKKQRPS